MRSVPPRKTPWDSFRYAVEGIVHVFRTQKHMRFHFMVVVLVLLLGLLSHFSMMQMVALIIVSCTVLAAEMFNTAVETVVDMITLSYHPLAKLAKDIAAGAVLLTAITASLVGLILFFGDHKIARLSVAVNRDPEPFLVLITLVVLVLVVVMIAKIMGGKGSILSGGVVSGHAAVSFLIATTIIYRAGHDPLSVILALLLALLVAQSRVEGKIHTVQEVVIGGLLGFCLTAGVYYFSIKTH